MLLLPTQRKGRKHTLPTQGTPSGLPAHSQAARDKTHTRDRRRGGVSRRPSCRQPRRDHLMLSRHQGAHKLPHSPRATPARCAAHTAYHQRDGPLRDRHRHPPRSHHRPSLHHRPRHRRSHRCHMRHRQQRQALSRRHARSQELPARHRRQPHQGHPAPPHTRRRCRGIFKRHHPRTHHHRTRKRRRGKHLGDRKHATQQ